MTQFTVVKLGGSLLEDAALRATALQAIANAWSDSHQVVVVHGGGKRVDALLSALGIAKKTAGGLRVTDDVTLPHVTSVLAGDVNKSLVAELARKGVSAVGISGIDGETVIADVHPPIDGVDLGNVGIVSTVHPELVKTLVAVGFLPLVASVALGTTGTPLNVNADAVASAIAASLGAAKLVFMTDVEGVRDADGEVVESLDVHSTRALLASPAVTGGMRPKLLAVLDALSNGVNEVVIAGPALHATVLRDGKGGTHLVAA